MSLRRFLLVLSCVVSIHGLMAQTNVVNRGTDITINSGAVFYVSGNYTESENASEILLNGDMHVGGNISAFDANFITQEGSETGRVILFGNIPQMINGPSTIALTLPTLEINKTNGNVALSGLSSLTILNKLTLTTGSFDIAASNLIFINPSAEITFTSGNKVISSVGEIRADNQTFQEAQPKLRPLGILNNENTGIGLMVERDNFAGELSFNSSKHFHKFCGRREHFFDSEAKD